MNLLLKKSPEKEKEAPPPVPELTTFEKYRKINWSFAFNAANAAFIQLSFFGSIFVLYLNELGMGKGQIGTVLSLLPFFDLIALVITPIVARFGSRRVFVLAIGLRTLITGFLLTVPAVQSQWGNPTVWTVIILIVISFAVFRSFATTAILPWQQEFIPNEIRGKYAAKNNIFTSLAGFAALSGASYLIGQTPQLSKFNLVFAAAVCFGLLSVWFASKIPGGAPRQGARQERLHSRQILAVSRDQSYRYYLLGVGLIILGTTPMASFLPLFMSEAVGLSAGNVVSLQTATLLGGLLSSYFWGWAADRYGSKPVMLSGVVTLAILPVFWFIMPRHSAWSLSAALAVSLFQGIVSLGWAIGSVRLLYVRLVPPEKAMTYMALYNAWFGIVTGASQVLSGRLLDAGAGLHGQLLSFPIDAYILLFIPGLALPLLSVFLFQRVNADSPVSMGKFAGMWLRGNPILAVESLIGFQLARGERATIFSTERLGRARSPLASEELLQALHDPRFNVRFEALVSIARNEPDARMIDALSKVLHGNDPAVSVMAAWALGRIGDPRAVETLREGLDSEYRSVRGHCARSLGALNDREIIPLLLDRLHQENDFGLRTAYASALGQMRAQPVTGTLLSLLRQAQPEDARMELALALARIAGDEHAFISIKRRVNADPGTALSQAITALEKKLRPLASESPDLLPGLQCSAEAFARNDLEGGAIQLSAAIRLLPCERLEHCCVQILEECTARLDEWGATRMDTPRLEYLFLPLQILGSLP